MVSISGQLFPVGLTTIHHHYRYFPGFFLHVWAEICRRNHEQAYVLDFYLHPDCGKNSEQDPFSFFLSLNLLIFSVPF